MISVPGNLESVPTNDSEQTILFVDDHQHFLRAVADLLNKSGLRVITSTDGTDALQKAREFDGVIHLLVADVQMPGMTGIELAIQLRRQRPNTKILLISAYDWGLLAQKYGWPFLQKPFQFDALNDSIRTLLVEQPSLKAADPADLAGGLIGQHARNE